MLVGLAPSAGNILVGALGLLLAGQLLDDEPNGRLPTSLAPA